MCCSKEIAILFRVIILFDLWKYVGELSIGYRKVVSAFILKNESIAFKLFHLFYIKQSDAVTLYKTLLHLNVSYRLDLMSALTSFKKSNWFSASEPLRINATSSVTTPPNLFT